MDSDIRENYAKIIEKKTKQIQLQDEAFTELLKIELGKIFQLQKEIKIIENSISLSENEKKEKIDKKEFEIKDIRKTIKRINKEKKESIGSHLNIGFIDDLYFKEELFKFDNI